MKVYYATYERRLPDGSVRSGHIRAVADSEGEASRLMSGQLGASGRVVSLDHERSGAPSWLVPVVMVLS